MASPHLLRDPSPSHLGIHDIFISNEVSINGEPVPLRMVKRFVIPFDPSGPKVGPFEKVSHSTPLDKPLPDVSSKEGMFPIKATRVTNCNTSKFVHDQGSHLKALLFRFHHFGWPHFLLNVDKWTWGSDLYVKLAYMCENQVLVYGLFTIVFEIIWSL